MLERTGLGQFASTGYPPRSKLGNATFHAVKVGDSLNLGNDPEMTLITSDPFSGIGAVGLGSSPDAFSQGTWDWAEWSPPSTIVDYVEVAHGTLTIPACPGKTIR